MNYQELMADFAANMGFEEFAPDGDGVCQLVGEDSVITIQNCEEIGLILVSAPLAELPPDADADLLKKLLAANYLYEKTAGSTIALDEEHRLLVLTRYDALALLDGATLRERLETFATVIDQWRQAIRDHVLASGDGATLPPGNFIRV